MHSTAQPRGVYWRQPLTIDQTRHIALRETAYSGCLSKRTGRAILARFRGVSAGADGDSSIGPDAHCLHCGRPLLSRNGRSHQATGRSGKCCDATCSGRCKKASAVRWLFYLYRGRCTVRDYLTLTQAAAKAGVSGPLLRRRIEAGLIDVFLDPADHRRRLVRSEDVEWLRQRIPEQMNVEAGAAALTA